MDILKNYNLTKLNTFGVSVFAKLFIELDNESKIKELFLSSEFKNNEKLFLGGGSNILFTKDFNGIVVLNKLKGISIIEENSKNVFIKSMGGEMWNDLVTFVVDHEYWGLENLSSIPGTVGAAPVQNIGAYGVEIKDSLQSIEVYDIETGEKKIFKKEECEFGYRSSVFKNKLKGKYFISSVTFKLNKKQNLNEGYEVLKKYLEDNKIEVKKPKDVSDAIVCIRKSKLPDPLLIGNAGSFFKNIYIDSKKAEEIKLKYQDVPLFEEDQNIKIPAGWLIEKCGWKGKRIGNIGMHDKQALVLVNYGGATGLEIKDFSEKVIASVFSNFGLILEREVNLI
ncbi:MAG: UDP-N-acetylenolpyruvoylglucosamine reductase [Candidatus Nomurabacteria bacterium GW2011_GWE1_32_28]|uniref:UDP-N-acetylenolpyruvoylglucosamine reductase n=1 Tax=Candidatus Nomurabacteria bacterium GW2011_GWF1_31_48 TaxID=1618767 RepID=A0A0G0BGZ5_9BACT|nr:MAG: UDP-N-acetylenolpyruvoylglucosamine reductase [Candidatus Nomurabacteria bacterium GW2011_GWF2_30_133]KKP28740.1 MAG: UDP-N-acetylenolpyruvoylglucosamine reductase [Candidatus Nomurabacteria bacterium GW2011_GWE2_31_40]KKP30317.1 MAG: UDP-N-acetylenolpyruvoylglucosamine reductase [Candidatus Nomurabacteria bacterium GW2011_GWF1_31_48]KKP34844.1 MAG: UDP-N-acetylenolpyruvoylglucosamine reductase [Candidatus Nomurabacteria bacterium GW2011_GWE1_32_28]HAS80698.1 UDP-N-acetylenolpyruvoylglu